MWFEISSSKKAREHAHGALKDGADLVIAWGGDGTVQRCIDALAGTGVTLAVIPAGTANLFATNVGIPIDLEGAVEVAAEGQVSHVDVGVANDEHFGVMAGVGLRRDDDRRRRSLGEEALWSRRIRLDGRAGRSPGSDQDARRGRRRALVLREGHLSAHRERAERDRRPHGRSRRRASRAAPSKWVSSPPTDSWSGDASSRKWCASTRTRRRS